MPGQPQELAFLLKSGKRLIFLQNIKIQQEETAVGIEGSHGIREFIQLRQNKMCQIREHNSLGHFEHGQM